MRFQPAVACLLPVCVCVARDRVSRVAVWVGTGPVSRHCIHWQKNNTPLERAADSPPQRLPEHLTVRVRATPRHGSSTGARKHFEWFSSAFPPALALTGTRVPAKKRERKRRHSAIASSAGTERVFCCSCCHWLILSVLDSLWGWSHYLGVVCGVASCPW